MALCSEIKSNEMIMEQTLHDKNSFDIISRALVINEKKARLYFVD